MTLFSTEFPQTKAEDLTGLLKVFYLFIRFYLYPLPLPMGAKAHPSPPPHFIYARTLCEAC